jgi:hypothetical protein
MNSSFGKLVVFSYWAGSLPRISELHFRSFRANNPGVRYVLHLDNSPRFSSNIDSELLKILIDCDIDIVSYSLESEMHILGVPPFARPLPKTLQRIGRKIYKFLVQVLQARSGMKPPGMFYSEKLGWTLWHKSMFSNLIGDPAYRADLFRSIELTKAENMDFIYTDLDICFRRPFEEMGLRTSFTSQWGVDDFANTAFLFVNSSNGQARNKIRSEIQSGRPPLPWILFTKDFCESNAIDILNIRLFDPAWTFNSTIEGRSDLFFSSGPHVDPFMKEVESLNWMIHWHNQWQIVAQVDSPYARLLSKFSM